MTLSSSQHEARIDAVVREVLARLRRGAAGGLGPADGRGGRQGKGASAPSDTADDQQAMHIAGPVISIATLQAVPPHVRRATIGATAVVTPAARDAARQRGLTLTVASPAHNLRAPSMSLLLADADCSLRQAAAVRQLQRRSVAVVPVAAAALLPRVIDGGGIGVLLSDLPAPHVCHACRHGQVRAAAVGSLDEAERIAAAMDVNLWVVDGKRLPLSRMLLLLQGVADLASRKHGPATPRTTP